MKKRIAFIGSGDMAFNIKNYIDTSTESVSVGIYDDFKTKGEVLNKLPILGSTDDVLNDYNNGNFDFLIISIGYTKMEVRQMYFEKFFGIVPLYTFIHESCIVHPSAKIGEGAVLFPGCIVDQNVMIYENVFVHLACTISHDSVIKKHCYLSPSVTLAGFVEIGEKCNIGVGTVISDNVTICESIRTGAGTIVVKNLNETGTYVGVPAYKIKDKK